MKTLFIAFGCLFFAVPAFIVILSVWGFSNFIGKGNEMQRGMWPERKRSATPPGQDRGSWQSEPLLSARSAS